MMGIVRGARMGRETWNVEWLGAWWPLVAMASEVGIVVEEVSVGW